MTKPRVGFLGTGWIGRHRMAAMVATGAIEAVAICDPSEECRAEAATDAPRAAVIADLDDMLALDLDGVVIATPSALHAAQAIRALDAGVAVFCQKPLGRSAAETQAVIDAARAADRLLGVDLSYRHTAAMAAIAPLVRSGDLGEVFAIDLTFHNAYGPGKPWFFDPERSGGGCVIDLGIHLVDLALWTLGFPAVDDVSAALFAKGQPLRPGEVEDYASARFHAGGAEVRLACSWHLHAGRDAVIEASFYGTKGGAALRNVGGSFYDFTAEAFAGTQARTLTAPPDDWGARSAAAWAVTLATDPRFDPAAEDFVQSAAVLDRIYGR
ncbi:gfo/Idh/MocA family oxidoreductase [Sphingomonas sp. MA1305]|uniref:Gfo/Idh/MocA family protein n=1 Tax=Sphingomonas sp. MA1305 TaxID=2479204 RepID=UPI001E2DC651|nr:Gfo/Idh/MocA family oxidoreductase [Sphingomonas sp. MA1305]MBI0474599.1 gfo/Idh/MocA family oxidoreductase [Sphingomonas sp. MA1305]